MFRLKRDEKGRFLKREKFDANSETPTMPSNRWFLFKKKVEEKWLIYKKRIDDKYEKIKTNGFVSYLSKKYGSTKEKIKEKVSSIKTNIRKGIGSILGSSGSLISRFLPFFVFLLPFLKVVAIGLLTSLGLSLFPSIAKFLADPKNWKALFSGIGSLGSKIVKFIGNSFVEAGKAIIGLFTGKQSKIYETFIGIPLAIITGIKDAFFEADLAGKLGIVITTAIGGWFAKKKLKDWFGTSALNTSAALLDKAALALSAAAVRLGATGVGLPNKPPVGAPVPTTGTPKAPVPTTGTPKVPVPTTGTPKVPSGFKLPEWMKMPKGIKIPKMGKFNNIQQFLTQAGIIATITYLSEGRFPNWDDLTKSEGPDKDLIREAADKWYGDSLKRKEEQKQKIIEKSKRKLPSISNSVKNWGLVTPAEDRKELIDYENILKNLNTSGQKPILSATTTSTISDLKDRSKIKFSEYIEKYSSKYGVDPNLVASVIKQESSFNPNAVGPQTKKGRAKGLMQIMPENISGIKLENPFDPEENIDKGTKYLASLIKKYKGNISKALAAYNWGMGNVDKFDKGKIEKIDHETIDYIKKITEDYSKSLTSKEMLAKSPLANNNTANVIAAERQKFLTQNSSGIKSEGEVKQPVQINVNNSNVVSSNSSNNSGINSVRNIPRNVFDMFDVKVPFFNAT